MLEPFDWNGAVLRVAVRGGHNNTTLHFAPYFDDTADGVGSSFELDRLQELHTSLTLRTLGTISLVGALPMHAVA